MYQLANRLKTPASRHSRTESFKIYPAFSLTVVTLDAFSAEDGSDDDSVVGYPKIFYPTGAGVAAGDEAKWVAASIETDAGCDQDSGAGSSVVQWATFTTTVDAADTASTSATGRTTSTSLLSSTVDEAALASSFTFMSPTLGSSRLHLCYKHQAEPYHLHTRLTLRTMQLVSATIRELGMEQTLTSITNSPQAVAFVAHGGMEGDRYKWVEARDSSSLNSASEAFFDVCADKTDPAAGSSVAVSAGFYQEASSTFSETASDLVLCYAPGSEPFMPYPAMTMNVLAPEISSASPAHLLVGRSSKIRLIGTFGLTSGDAMKLAESADGDCEGKAAGGDEIIFYPDSTAAGLTVPALGTSGLTLFVSERTKENRPFKLCYRFGTIGAWELFDNVSWEAYQITGVLVDDQESSPSTGEHLAFTFSGSGIVNGGAATLGHDFDFTIPDAVTAPLRRVALRLVIENRNQFNSQRQSNHTINVHVVITAVLHTCAPSPDGPR